MIGWLTRLIVLFGRSGREDTTDREKPRGVRIDPGGEAGARGGPAIRQIAGRRRVVV
jgi:hypothetical protein